MKEGMIKCFLNASHSSRHEAQSVERRSLEVEVRGSKPVGIWWLVESHPSSPIGRDARSWISKTVDVTIEIAPYTELAIVLSFATIVLKNTIYLLFSVRFFFGYYQCCSCFQCFCYLCCYCQCCCCFYSNALAIFVFALVNVIVVSNAVAIFVVDDVAVVIVAFAICPGMR